MRKSESERPMSISLLHFKWPKNISFRSESTVFWSGLFECFRLFRFESSTHHTLYAGSLCCCCYCWFGFFLFSSLISICLFRFSFLFYLILTFLLSFSSYYTYVLRLLLFLLLFRLDIRNYYFQLELYLATSA